MAPQANSPKNSRPCSNADLFTFCYPVNGESKPGECLVQALDFKGLVKEGINSLASKPSGGYVTANLNKKRVERPGFLNKRVCAGTQSILLQFSLKTPGEHDNRHLCAFGSQSAKHIQPALTGQIPVQDDEIELALVQ